MVIFKNISKFLEVVALSLAKGSSHLVSRLNGPNQFSPTTQIFPYPKLSNYRIIDLPIKLQRFETLQLDTHIRIRNGSFGWPSCRYSGL